MISATEPVGAHEVDRRSLARLRLSEWFEEVVLPLVLRPSGVRGQTIAEYRSSLHRWIDVTGDPPMRRITPETLSGFVAGLKRLRNKTNRKNQPLGLPVQYTTCTHIQAMLALAGSPSRRFPYAFDVLADTPIVPWADEGTPIAGAADRSRVARRRRRNVLSKADRQYYDRMRQPVDPHKPPKLTARLTLLEFFAFYARPVWLASRNSSPKTVNFYEEGLARWATHTGDPSLRRINDHVTAQFSVAMHNLCNGEDAEVSPATASKYCGAVQTILRLAGPRTYSQRNGQGLIEPVFIERPQVDPVTPQDCFTIDELGAILEACRFAEKPTCYGIDPTIWWRSLVRLAYNTGERIGALLAVEFGHQSKSGTMRALVFPRGIRKGRARSHVVPLNDAALAAVEAMRDNGAERSLILPWSHEKKALYAHWRRILSAAQVPEERQWGFHALRRTAATQMAEISATAAQLLLGHANSKTTFSHYINPSVLRRAVRDMPQPADVLTVLARPAEPTEDAAAIDVEALRRAKPR